MLYFRNELVSDINATLISNDLITLPLCPNSFLFLSPFSILFSMASLVLEEITYRHCQGIICHIIGY